MNQLRHQLGTNHISRRPRILGTWNPSLMCTVIGLMKDPYLHIAHRKMKARTPLVSHQRGNVIGGPSYLMQCMQGWDHRHLVKIGRVQPRPRRHILVPQPHPSHKAIPHTNNYDESGKIRQVKPPLQLSHYQLWAPKRVPRAKIFHIRWIQRSIWLHHALSTTHDSWYKERCTVMQGLPPLPPRHPPRPSSLMVPSTPHEFCW